MKKINNSISKLALLRSLVILSLFGMPGIVQFDTSGITHTYGIFNLQSFSRMTVYIAIGIIVFLFFVGIKKLKINKNNFSYFSFPILYYSIALIISIPMLKGTEFLLSSYFIFEWLTFLILFYLYVMEHPNFSISIVIKDIILVIWLKISTLLLIIPILPTLGIFFDPVLGVMRLGGYFIGPNVLATLAALLASYYYFFYDGPSYKKYSIFIGGVVISVILTYADYLMRGLDISNLITLSERVPLWGKYALEFPRSPIIGFGYISGVKNLSLIIPKIHWIAPHAHNDFIQSFISGGVIMGLFTIGVYWSLFRKCYQSFLPTNLNLLMKNWFIILFGYAMLTPIINWKLFAVSGIFWMLFISLKIEYENIICT